MAMVDGREVMPEELAAGLSESAGGVALEELVIDRRLASALEGKGIRIGEEEVRREEALLREALARGAGSGAGVGSEDQAAELVRALQRAQGLGPVRYGALLRRSAGLRALVRDQVQVTEEAVQVAYAAVHGPKHKVRLIVLATQREAGEVLGRLRGVEAGEALLVRFAAEAAARSTDASGPRGGEIEAFSVQDPAYPAVLRQTVAATPVGGLTPVMALSKGFGIALVMGVEPGSGVTLDAAREALRADVRLRQERVLMEREAARLLGTGGVTVLDGSLEFGWRTRRAAP
ncbi:MAG: peptidylprolyl isomerase [Phycisphaerae bacterium]|nr:peptidylprolyl isomerase [Phycisphaerae bacterium]